jgi:signal transduction histidine kinase/DNA-binding response OmpR family regulator
MEEERLNQVDGLRHVASREGWHAQHAEGGTEQEGYLFDQTSVQPLPRGSVLNGDGLVIATRATESLPTSAPFLSSPIALRGEVIGKLGIIDDPTNPLGPAESDFIDAISSQIAIALENARLFEETQAARDEAEILYRASQRIATAGSLAEIVAAIAEASPVQMDWAVLAGADSDGDEQGADMVCIANWHGEHGTPPVAVGARFGKSAIEAVRNILMAGTPLFSNDVLSEPRIDPAYLWSWRQLRVRAAIVLPIMAAGRHTASLLLARETPHQFSESEIRICSTLTQQMSTAFENRQLLSEMERRVLDRTAELSRANSRLTQQNEFMAALHETALSLMNRLDLSDVLQSIVGRAAGLAGTRHGYLYLLTPHVSEMVMQIGTGLFERRVGERIKLGQSVAGVAWQSGQPLAVADYPHWADRVPDPVLDQLRTLIAVPLKSGDRIVGVLGLGHTEDDRALMEQPAIKHVLQFSELATIALDNARLYTEAQQELAERKRVEHELEIARDQAVEASRLKSEFLANMSHEIRTPMNAVVGMTGLLTSTRLDTRQQYFVDTIRSSSDALLTIINDILDLSKMEAGKLALENIEFSALASVEEAAELLAPRAREKNLALMTFVSPEIPTVLQGDPGRLQQILVNLIGNAVKFTERGQVVVSASLEDESRSHVVVRFAITDTGIGLSEESHQRIFEPFTQADGSTTRKYGGTGLGLSISRRLAELMNGTINVVSEDGKGSTFWFNARFEKVALAAAIRVPALTPDLAGARILVVDESVASREFLHRYMAAWGLRDSVTSNAHDALSMLRRAAVAHEPYDAIIVDLILNGSDAFTIAKQVRQEPALDGTKLILLTAFDEQGLSQRAMDSGFAAYLVKPVKQSQLFDTIAQVMGSQTGLRGSYSKKPAPSARVESIFPGGKSPVGVLILVAEDHPVNREVAILQLQQLGLPSNAVSNGLEALEAIARTQYTLLLMDCQMPEMDGYEATRQIRIREAGTGRRLPIIAMTAHAMQGDRELCLAAGMDDYVSKPVTLEKLQAVLQPWMPRRKLQPPVAAPMADGGNSVRPAEATHGPVDLTVIVELRSMQGDDHEFMTRLIETYFAQTDILLKNMRAAAVRGDAETLRQAAHKLKGGSAVLGVKNLANICYDLELQGRSGSLHGAVEKIDLAETEYASVREALQHEITGAHA